MVQGVSIQDGCILDCNPATGELIAKVPCTTREELSSLIQNANAAQPAWADTPLETRVEALKKGCRAFANVGEELAKLITAEMGKPILEAKLEAAQEGSKDALLDLAFKANAEEVLGDDGGAQSLVVRDPLGVVAVISPWNFPCELILQLSLPALVAGNTVIVKPSEVTPLSGALTVTTLASCLPNGVLQLAQGNGAVGSLLAEAEGVNMVAMMGSTAVGKSIMSSCATKLKRLVLELGGKDPMVVFEDADLDLAAHDAVAYSLYNAGQMCCSVERVYVASAIKSVFEEKVVEIAAGYHVGDGSDPKNNVGPLVSQRQRDTVAAQVDDAVSTGAKVLFQSQTPELQPDGTSFYPITVLSNVKQNMEIQKTETFGPIIALASFDGSEEEAVRLANDTEYGLTSCVYTTDNTKASRVARRIRSGQVGINCYSLFYAAVGCPWVGHKSSGFGYHSGVDGFRQFSVPKSLVFTSSVKQA